MCRCTACAETETDRECRLQIPVKTRTWKFFILPSKTKHNKTLISWNKKMQADSEVLIWGVYSFIIVHLLERNESNVGWIPLRKRYYTFWEDLFHPAQGSQGRKLQRYIQKLSRPYSSGDL